MRNLPGLPPGSILGYCTNVHAGTTLEQMQENVQRFATSVRSRMAADQPLPLGLWLSAQSAHQILKQDATGDLLSWLDENNFEPFTFNGFPFGDFHQAIVKHAVYRPHWAETSRLEYTSNLAAILSELVGADSEASVSTVPLGWPDDFRRPAAMRDAQTNIRELVNQLHQIEEFTGCTVHVDLEPEPGCQIQDGKGLVDFLKPLINGKHGDRIQKYVRVCHDICHAAVMFEDQAEMFARYKAAGIQIGKVQISNAIRADLRNLSAPERVDALWQLRQFSEDRYLHQTMIRDGDHFTFLDDLPKALSEYGTTDRGGDEWRIHFHVPVYLESFGLLKTTREYITECMRLLKNSEVKHWEVETYAWNVLPKDLQVHDLAEGIAKELLWVKEQAAKIA